MMTRFDRCRSLAIIPVLALVSACSFPRTYTAYGHPKVPVEVRHPPGAGFVVEEVAIAPLDRSLMPERMVGGDGLDPVTCRSELVQTVTQGLIALGIAVVPYGNRPDADAVIAINVTRCSSNKSNSKTSREIVEEKGGNTRRRNVDTFHAETAVDLAVLVRLTDPSANDRMLAVLPTITSHEKLVTSSPHDYPAFPSTTAAITRAYIEAWHEIKPLFVERVDTSRIVFFTASVCGMTMASSAARAGNYQRALELSLENVESCHPDPEAEISNKDVAAARYNVGALYRIMGDFESALEHLQLASVADPTNRTIADAIAEALSAEAASAEMRRVAGQDNAMAQVVEDVLANDDVIEKPLTNDDVIGMVEDGWADEVVIQAIETSKVDFHLSRAAQAELTRQGVSSAVIRTMMKAAGTAPPREES